MSRAYTYRSKLLSDTAQTLGASETNTVISGEFSISDGDAERIWVSVDSTAGTYATGITFKIQTSFDGGDSWVTVAKTGTTIGSDATFQFSLDGQVASDQASFPLGTMGRVVATTGAGDAVTISGVRVSSRV